MPENKTTMTQVPVERFLATVEHPVRRADAETLIAMMSRLSGEPPKMYGPTIVGFGFYDYRYASGHGGTAPRLGFAPRKAELVVYLTAGFAGREEQLARLGKHRFTKCCLYIKKLADVDLSVLEEIIVGDLAFMDEKYPRAA